MLGREDHESRSAFIRGLVQRVNEPDVQPAVLAIRRPPQIIVQFWDDRERLPDDVAACVESWRRLEERGFDVRLFDDAGARELISSRLGPRHEKAYARCYHPAMQSDYFRLCWLLLEGGCYLDADDVHNGPAIDHLFDDGRLKIQPLCYDVATEQMVPPKVFTEPAADASTWIFYFNNNPLFAGPGHPIIERALLNATESLEQPTGDALPEIQSTTGPGNLTRSIFEHAQEHGEAASALSVLHDWEEIATSRWPLSYRGDERNWRLSNQRAYRPAVRGEG